MESLNIDHHTKRLVLKALNKAETDKEAALLLGCSLRQLYLYKKQYDIVFVKEVNLYFTKTSILSLAQSN